MDWNDLKYFLAVANGHSLSAASSQLGVSPSTVSRRIEALETALSSKLFRSHRDGYDLTAAGKELLLSGERAEAQMRVFERTAQGKDSAQSGSVRLDVPELLGQMVVLPALVQFLEQHPEIKIEMHSSVQPVKLAGEEADIVIRLVRPTRGNYQQRKVGAVEFGFFASTSYLVRHGTPSKPEDLSAHRIIGWTENLRYLTMSTWFETLCPSLQPSLRLSSLTAQIIAAETGLGIALLPSFSVVASKLKRVLHKAPRFTPDLWMLVHSQAQELRRVKLVKRELTKILANFETSKR